MYLSAGTLVQVVETPLCPHVFLHHRWSILYNNILKVGEHFPDLERNYIDYTCPVHMKQLLVDWLAFTTNQHTNTTLPMFPVQHESHEPVCRCLVLYWSSHPVSVSNCNPCFVANTITRLLTSSPLWWLRKGWASSLSPVVVHSRSITKSYWDASSEGRALYFCRWMVLFKVSILPRLSRAVLCASYRPSARIWAGLALVVRAFSIRNERPLATSTAASSG